MGDCYVNINILTENGTSVTIHTFGFASTTVLGSQHFDNELNKSKVYAKIEDIIGEENNYVGCPWWGEQLYSSLNDLDYVLSALYERQPNLVYSCDIVIPGKKIQKTTCPLGNYGMD